MQLREIIKLQFEKELTDKFQSELSSNFLIGRKFSQLSLFRPIREHWGPEVGQA